MTDNRLDHLADVATRLWPSPHVATLAGGPVRGHGGGHGVPGSVPMDEYLVLPSRHRPRLLAPTGRRAAAAVVRHHGEGRNASARLKAAVLALGLRAGLGTLVFRDRLQVNAPEGTTADTLLTHLATVLGRDVVMGMHLGAPRANRKPVLQLVSRDGETFAYAKLGVDPLTDALVDREAAALTELASAVPSVVRVPALLHHDSWRGHRLLVQSSLPVWSRRRPMTEERLAAAVRETAEIGGLSESGLVRSPFWADLNDRVEHLPAGPTVDRLRRLLGLLSPAAADVPIMVGASHGDWTPWNMACVDEGLLVWDWERFRHRVPLGFDLLHHRLQTRLVTRLENPEASARRLVQEGGALLRPLGVAPDAATVTTLLYLADLATRYLADRQLEAGARLGDVGAWLLPALADGVEQRGTNAWA